MRSHSVQYIMDTGVNFRDLCLNVDPLVRIFNEDVYQVVVVEHERQVQLLQLFFVAWVRSTLSIKRRTERSACEPATQNRQSQGRHEQANTKAPKGSHVFVQKFQEEKAQNKRTEENTY